jgi:hypothetical protein
VHGQRQLLELPQKPGGAVADPGDQSLGRLGVEAQTLLAGSLDDPPGELPRLRREMLMDLATGVVDGLAQASERLPAHDQHQDRLGSGVRDRDFERLEIAGLPGSRVVDEQVAGPASPA